MNDRIKNVIEICTYRCTLTTCNAETMTPHSDDPRKRWVTDLWLPDPEGCLACESEILGDKSANLTHTCEAKKVNLCPDCARALLGLTEQHYQRLEKAEAIAAGKRPVSELLQ